MKDLFVIEREEYDFPGKAVIPPECTHSIFIPSYGKNLKHHYFLVNFRTKRITCWNIDLTPAKDDLKKRLDVEKIESVPWNQSLDMYLEAIHFAHSALYHDNYIYISYINTNFVLALNVNDSSYRVLYDPVDGMTKLHSATNVIYNNELYFSRYSIEDTFEHLRDENRKPLRVEVGKYNLANDEVMMLGSFEGPDDIHSTFISSDGKKLFLIEMSQDPKKPFPKQTSDLPVELAKEIMNEGLRDSEIILFDIETREVSRTHLPGGPAHIEVDPANPEFYYISSHNLCTNLDTLNCFGESRIDKVRITGNTLSFEGHYAADDFLRTPSHQLFTYKGDVLMPVPVFPNQVHMIKVDKMEIFKKFQLVNQAKQVDFSSGPIKYPPASADKTPYTVNPAHECHYLYLTSLWNVTLYDFENSVKSQSVIYNTNKNIIATGHANLFHL